MLRLIRGLFRRRVPIRALSDAAEMRLKNQRFLGKKNESERWERRMRSLARSLRAHGDAQAAIDLEEAIGDMLTKKREG